MQTLNFPGFISSETEVSPVLNVVITYEDLETGKRAMKTYDYLIEHLGSQCLFANQMWKFDVLAVPKLREMAAKDAAAADIIIISAHAGNELPPEVKAWIDLWLSYTTHASALVGMFGTESVENPMRDYLAAIARRAKLEFFCQPGIWPGMGADLGQSSPAWERNERTFSALATVLKEEPVISHWGINE